MPKLSTIIKRYEQDVLSTMRLSCSVLSEKVIDRTPVDDGVLKRSWTPGRNEVNTSNAGGQADAVINNIQLGDKFTLGNGQPYARRIEYEGHSKHKAPKGMLRISVAEWDAIVAGATRGKRA